MSVGTASQLPDNVLSNIMSFLVTHEPLRDYWHQEQSDGTLERGWHLHTWTPGMHYAIVKVHTASRNELIVQPPAHQTHTDGSENSVLPHGEHGCICCRAHAPETWWSEDTCPQCVQGWILSCVGPCWWLLLKTMARNVTAADRAIREQRQAIDFDNEDDPRDGKHGDSYASRKLQ